MFKSFHIKVKSKKMLKLFLNGIIAGLTLYKKKDIYVWRFRYKLGNKQYPLISLKEAR